MVDIIRALRSAAKTGTVEMGVKEARQALEANQAQALVVARNVPADFREALLAAAEENNIPVVDFQGTNVELGPALGKPFAVSSAAIVEPGESDILQAAR